MHRWLPVLITLPSLAAEPPDFAHDVRPILEARCVKCHGPEEQNGGLRYDEKTAALAQADSGHRAIVAGKPDESELLKRITSNHKDEQMPPKGKRLSSDEIETLRRWIAAGAVWPENSTPVVATKPRSQHWSFQPISEPALPAVKDKS